MNFVYAFLAVAAVLALAFWISRRDSRKIGEQSAIRKALEAENEAISRRPITDSDLVDSLLRKAADKSKDYSQR